MTRNGIALLALLATGGQLSADFSYQQETKVTGGMMAGMMKIAGAFSKSAREPMRSTISVKDNRMLNHMGDTAHIIDLDREAITSIDFNKKTYSEITFAEMAQAIERAMQKMKQDKNAQKVDVNLSASVRPTENTRQIQGMTAKQVILSMEMMRTDSQSGQQGGMMMVSDMWMAPKVAGYEEVADFYQRMGQKLAWTPGMGGLTMGRSDMAKGFANLYKEMAKLDGMPLLQVITMRPKMDPETEKKLVEAMAEQQASGGASQAQQQQQQTPSTAESASGAPAGRLGRLGGLGGFGRRKKQEDPPPQQQAPAQQAGGAPSAPGALIEITTETSNFSTAAVDASKMEVPAGFKKVESDLAKGLQ